MGDGVTSSVNAPANQPTNARHSAAPSLRTLQPDHNLARLLSNKIDALKD